MKVERALECAVMAAEDKNPWSEALKALADEVKRLREQPRPRSMSEAPRVWFGIPTVIEIWRWSSDCWLRGHSLGSSDVFVAGHLPEPAINPGAMGWVAGCSEVDWLPSTTAAGGSGNLMVDTKSGIVDPMGVNPTPGGSEWQEHGEGWSDEAMLAGGSEEES